MAAEMGRGIAGWKKLRYNAFMKDWKNIFKRPQKSVQVPARTSTEPVLRQALSREDEKTIEEAVHRTIREYGETLKKLGDD